MAGERLLIVEDDPLLLSVLAERLRREGLEVSTAATLAEAHRALDAADPDVGLLDLRLPDGEGLSLLREAGTGGGGGRGGGTATAWVVMTAHATVSSAVEALKLGARDYLEKPFTLDRAVATVRQALELTALKREVAALRDRSSLAGTTVIGESPAMQRVFELVERLAAVDATTVLIEGESGTGKGAIAQALHRLSRRSGGPFLNVTSSALPETLMESELFGHEKGAFTDAHSSKRGLVEMADGGTLFLDEVGELAPGVQGKLLRFIEEKAFRRLGGTRDLTVDVRIMAATNRDLAAEVAAGRFRADLFYRLRVIPITLPPLRERREDIAPLVKHFVAHFDREFGKRVREILPEALAKLTAYPWPGNVRELRNVVERAVLLTDGTAIGLAELPPEVTAPLEKPVPAAALPSSGVKLDDVERRLLVEALERAHGNQSQAAELLGISRHQVRTRMKRHGLLTAVLLAAAFAGGIVVPGRLAAQGQPGGAGGGGTRAAAASLACLRCHGSREFLERAAPAGQFRRSLVISPAGGAGGAHRTLSCLSCHPGATAFPHSPAVATPVPCGSCHAGADSAWRASVHSRAKNAGAVVPGGVSGSTGGAKDAGDSSSASSGAVCVDCHGAHEVRPKAWLESRDGQAAMNWSCARCHPSQVAMAQDVHLHQAGCADCHGSHAIRPVRDPETHGVPVAMARRCAACHQPEARLYWADAHGRRALLDAAGAPPLGSDTAPVVPGGSGGSAGGAKNVGVLSSDSSGAVVPGGSGGSAGGAKNIGVLSSDSSGATCVDCHWGHAVRAPRDRAALFAVADACIQCHPAYGATFRENYHGQATRVGSERAALCADCHTAHQVYPASDARSSVSAANRLATCRRCHAEARGLFADYRPHADPTSAAGAPGLHAIWLAMNILLGAVTLVYVAHAILVSRRTLLERRQQR